MKLFVLGIMVAYTPFLVATVWVFSRGQERLVLQSDKR